MEWGLPYCEVILLGSDSQCGGVSVREGFSVRWNGDCHIVRSFYWVVVHSMVESVSGRGSVSGEMGIAIL